MEVQGHMSQEMKKGTIPNRDVCRNAVDHEFSFASENTTEFIWLDSKDSRYRNFNLINSPHLQRFSRWKIRFKNQVTACSDFLSEAMLWIKEVEMVDSVDELKCSRSFAGNNFPNFEMLDTISQIPTSRRRSVSRSRKPNRRVGSSEEDRIANMIYDYFRVTGAHDTVLDYADLFSVTLHGDNIQQFDTRWDEVPLSFFVKNSIR